MARPQTPPLEHFTLATIATHEGPIAAMVIEGRTYPLGTLAPELHDKSTLAVLSAWGAMLPKLQALADCWALVLAGGEGTRFRSSSQRRPAFQSRSSFVRCAAVRRRIA